MLELNLVKNNQLPLRCTTIAVFFLSLISMKFMNFKKLSYGVIHQSRYTMMFTHRISIFRIRKVRKNFQILHKNIWKTNKLSRETRYLKDKDNTFLFFFFFFYFYFLFFRWYARASFPPHATPLITTID